MARLMRVVGWTCVGVAGLGRLPLLPRVPPMLSTVLMLGKDEGKDEGEDRAGLIATAVTTGTFLPVCCMLTAGWLTLPLSAVPAFEVAVLVPAARVV